MTWENDVVNRIKTRDKIKKMIDESIKAKYSELEKAFLQDGQLKKHPLTKPNNNKIKIGMKEIKIDNDDVIGELNTLEMNMDSVTKDDIDKVVENIILNRVYNAFKL